MIYLPSRTAANWNRLSLPLTWFTNDLLASMTAANWKWLSLPLLAVPRGLHETGTRAVAAAYILKRQHGRTAVTGTHAIVAD